MGGQRRGRVGDQALQPEQRDLAQLLLDDPLLGLRVVVEPVPDRVEDLRLRLAGREDEEDLVEAALVVEVGPLERGERVGVGGNPGLLAAGPGGLPVAALGALADPRVGGDRQRDLGPGQAAQRGVGRGQQSSPVGIGAAGRDRLRPGRCGAAGEQVALGLRRREPVEPVDIGDDAPSKTDTE
ncbi:hypothetical protein GCM10009687_13120 [Asanoa iriomotensis]|uniref:Uncharacterized protein n=1 Tax=Asanoa iriomotensis TaxID=234613 RepID=A0ABQ4CFS6_9ACTN|nr:hypothetical protein Air01nite_77220 [Asanoa iriomotensis]